ncbi:MAG TPA: prepilin-type N-terminal cleavage/methylation domain-containing protein [Candidatus Woesebacteria bacterium]|nr:prepilin-type N-terminal cleavage/methylation domain-containing protein [Candidatus Woesebacteria bacterium]
MNKKAFTLIEMLIVLTVTAILIPTVFSIVIVIMRQQVRIYKVVETRRQGDYILTFIKEKLVRSSQMLDFSTGNPLCTAANSNSAVYSESNGGSNIAFLDNQDVQYRIFAQTASGVTNLMYASPATASGITINNNLVQVTDFSLQCGRRLSFLYS